MVPYVQNNDTSFLIPELNDLVPGFHVGIVSNLKLNEYVDLRFLPGISLGQRKILFPAQKNLAGILMG